MKLPSCIITFCMPVRPPMMASSTRVSRQLTVCVCDSVSITRCVIVQHAIHYCRGGVTANTRCDPFPVVTLLSCKEASRTSRRFGRHRDVWSALCVVSRSVAGHSNAQQLHKLNPMQAHAHHVAQPQPERFIYTCINVCDVLMRNSAAFSLHALSQLWSRPKFVFHNIWRSMAGPWRR